MSLSFIEFIESNSDIMDLILFYLHSRELLRLQLTCKKWQVWIDDIFDQCQNYGIYAKKWPDIYLKLTDKKYKEKSIYYPLDHNQLSLDFIIDSINYIVTILSDDHSEDHPDILLKTLDAIKTDNPTTKKKIDSLCKFKCELIKHLSRETVPNLNALINDINALFSEGEIHSIPTHQAPALANNIVYLTEEADHWKYYGRHKTEEYSYCISKHDTSKTWSLHKLLNTLMSYQIAHGNPDNIRLNTIIKQLYYRDVLLNTLESLSNRITSLEKQWSVEHPIAHHIKILFALPKRLFLTGHFQKAVYYLSNLILSLFGSLVGGVGSGVLLHDIINSWRKYSTKHLGLIILVSLVYLSLYAGNLYLFIYTVLRGESPAENETLPCCFRKRSPINTQIGHEKNNHPSIHQLRQYHAMLCTTESCCDIHERSTPRDLMNHLESFVKIAFMKLQNFISPFEIYHLKRTFKQELTISLEGENEDHENQKRMFLARHTLFGKNTVNIDNHTANPCCSINIYSLLARFSKLRQEMNDETMALSKRLGLAI